MLIQLIEQDQASDQARRSYDFETLRDVSF
jgi:hypothetical protein